MPDDKGLHSGHRNRMREKFIHTSLDGFETHEALELLLYYAIPRKDTNPIAHRLLDNFGSLSAVFDAPLDSLKQSGLSENAAVFIKLIPNICRLYLDDKNSKDKVVDASNIGDRLVHKFIGRDYETVYLLLLDAKCKELYCGIINKGSVNSTDLYVRSVIEKVMMYNAVYAVIAHNHPSGLALPSMADINTTISLAKSLRLVGTRLLDHIVVADEDYVSMKQSKLCDEAFT